jgi:alpha 1,2-mannosyltransferase
MKLHSEFWKTFHPVLTEHNPDCPSPEKSQQAQSVRYDPINPVERPDFIKMSAADIKKMRQKHAGFVKAMNKLGPPHYVPGTRGLVTTAGGRYLPVLTISLRMLRRAGSTLPMEVFLASDEEYEPYICEVVLARLNAKCVILENILKADGQHPNIRAYQYKPFAMLFSSFEELLFLDADAFPIHDPTVLFTSDPFRSLKMVTWPDFWASSASHIYYEISSRPVPKTTERASTESGELLISKKSHYRTLLLATYYNYYGPSHYYVLFSQGGPGEGDKETFIAAATAMSEPFYQVSEPIRAIGHRAKDGGMVGSAMVQYDPIEDYELTQSGLWRVKDQSVAPSPRPFFIHANFPKFNPATIFEPFDIDPVHGPDGGWTRPWTIAEDTMEQLGDEIQRRFWAEIEEVACQLEGKFASWQGKKDICKGVRDYVKEVF